MADFEPIRVLNLFTILNRGGAETMVMNYYRHIDRTRVQFDFLVHREERGAYEDEIESLGGRIFRMMPVRPWTAGAYRRAIRVFFSEHPEYRILHAHMSELGLYAFQEAKRMGIPVRICHAHNAPHGIDLKSPVRWYMKTRMRPYITHRFMCGYESGLWLFGSRYRDSFIQMNNAVDAAAFRYDAARRAEVRRMLELPEGSLTVGHVGRFNYRRTTRSCSGLSLPCGGRSRVPCFCWSETGATALPLRHWRGSCISRIPCAFWVSERTFPTFCRRWMCSHSRRILRDCRSPA